MVIPISSKQVSFDRNVIMRMIVNLISTAACIVAYLELVKCGWHPLILD